MDSPLKEPRKAPRLHLVEKKDKMRQISSDKHGTVWESGYWWRFGEKNAEALIGATVYFHESQKSASHAGGIITGCRKPRADEKQQTTIFTYLVPNDTKSKASFIGIDAGEGGWTGGGVRKIVMS